PAIRESGSAMTLWVKKRRTQSEHNESSLPPEDRHSSGYGFAPLWALSRLCCSPTRNCLLATGERFCDLASSFDEELRHRAEGPILQGHNSDRPTGNRQFDRQFPDEWMRVWQLQPKFGENREIAARFQEIGSHVER